MLPISAHFIRFTNRLTGFGVSLEKLPSKTPIARMGVLLGEPPSIILEHLFDDLFTLRDRFKELGMVIKGGKVYLPDVEERDV